MHIGMNTLVPLFLAAIVTVFACGTAQQLYEPPIPDKDPFTFTEIPFGFDHGYPYVTVRIDSTDCEVFLDTGAAGVTVALLPETIESLGLAQTGGTRHLRTNYGEVSYRRSVAPSLKLGDLTYRNVLCDQQDPDIPASHEPRGIMGLALLRQFNVLIDYRAGTLALYSQSVDGPDRSSWQRIPLLDEPDGLHIRALLPGMDRQLKLCLDTGAIAARDQNTRFYNILRPEWLDSFTGVEEYGGMRLVESQELIAGDTGLSDLHFIGLDFHEPKSTDGFLGADFFMKHRVFIDFANEVLYVQPYE